MKRLRAIYNDYWTKYRRWYVLVLLIGEIVLIIRYATQYVPLSAPGYISKTVETVFIAYLLTPVIAWGASRHDPA